MSYLIFSLFYKRTISKDQIKRVNVFPNIINMGVKMQRFYSIGTKLFLVILPRLIIFFLFKTQR